MYGMWVYGVHFNLKVFSIILYENVGEYITIGFKME